MAKNLLSINVSETGITSRGSSHKYQKTNLIWKSKEFQNKVFLINTECFIHCHQHPICAPCIILTFPSSRNVQLTPQFMILLVLIFIVNWNFNLLNWHNILCYYHLCCCHLLSAVIYTYTHIYIIYFVVLTCIRYNLISPLLA